MGTSPLYFLNPKRNLSRQDCNEKSLVHYVKASSVNKELNGPQKGRRKWVGQLAERERGTLGKSQAEKIHHQVMEEVECMKLRRGNQPRLERERE